ncbi:MAG: apolipoprotein N-acyltransferase, partial [Flavobacteriales bacterium]|nr:apolipoprotein N-acyltransferase [Flavobacteriales bacterium]
MNAWYHHLFLAILSGILLSISWPVNGIPFLVFFAFIPILYIGYSIQKTCMSRCGLRFFAHIYLAFFLWNLFTTYWIFFSSPEGAYLAILVNALLMALIWVLYFYTYKVLGKKVGYISLIAYWLAFEFLHLDWDLSWPWLMLGNV